jgi:hypothetical protein
MASILALFQGGNVQLRPGEGGDVVELVLPFHHSRTEQSPSAF